MAATLRVHIVGCERSGTTLLLEMMTAGFRFAARCDREQSLFEEPPTGAASFLSKKPLDILRLETAFRHDPNLFVLYAVRDPRSVITSRHAGRPDRYLSDFENWKACEAAAARLGSHERFLRVRYEQLVEEPDALQAQIGERFAFLERTGTFSTFHRTAAPTNTGKLALGGVRPVETGRIAGWRADLPRVKAEVLRHRDLPAVLIDRGYEPDETWLGSLDEVEPSPGPRRSGTPTWLRRIDRLLRYRWKTRRYLARLRS
ncbi:MAG: sulfotransferase [Candidatus Binatia bacterium]|nr:sulfotransferase [Candidatus Binatia bacterium]